MGEVGRRGCDRRPMTTREEPPRSREEHDPADRPPSGARSHLVLCVPRMRSVIRWSGAAVLLVVGGGSGCSLEDALNADARGDTGDTGDTGGSADGDDDDDDDDAAPTTGSVDGTEETGEPPPACADHAVRLASYNIEAVGAAGGESFEALRATLARIDADVVCVQEIVDGEAVAFAELAELAGYDYVLKADQSPPIGGDLSNGCMARFPLDVLGSWGSGDLADDPQANEVGRDFLAVRADLSEAVGAPCWLGLITLHLKSGQEPIDWFRRQIETIRLAQAADVYRGQHPEDPLVILGDFNETLDDVGLGSVFESAPPDLPGSYQLGTDITFPMTYQPFAVMDTAGFTITSPGQEDAPDRKETWRDIVRLDYVWLDGPQYVTGEVYNACRDDGVDDAPQGDGIEKAGDPLSCDTGELASDHFPVIVDVTLP